MAKLDDQAGRLVWDRAWWKMSVVARPPSAGLLYTGSGRGANQPGLGYSKQNKMVASTPRISKA